MFLQKPLQPVRIRWACLIFLSCLAVAACGMSKAALLERAERHPTRSIAHWGQDWKKTPLRDRIAKAPAALIEKIGIENEAEGFAERPAAAEPAPEFREVLSGIASSLPPRVRELAEERIIGVFLVNGLGGTGYAEAVLDGRGEEFYALIVLDREVLLGKKANAWASWKENSFFRPGGPGTAISVTIERDGQDSVANAIRYILLHEMGHALGMASGVHPSWYGKAIASEFYPFTTISWKGNGEEAVSRFEEAFPERGRLRPYQFEKSALERGQAAEVYGKLFGLTNFPTIHSAQNLWEDFAESFVNYLHTSLAGRPYEVRLRNGDGRDRVFRDCWQEDRCRGKRDFMARWFANPRRNP
ncbi:MAG: hypothetical protein A4E73_02342 [Syntrophaceae bacterium PtaU1.Bin231]|nr:MAG: hypothetical protein A4E73_02342 [Syntrophaceae bacterium PtaU1.Bin231]HOG15776.1 hypothetical protein [Syntrophales bacterium]